MKNKFRYYLLIITFLFLTFFADVSGWSFNRSFYQYEYNDLAVAETIGISEKALNEATAVLLAYTQGKREDLVYRTVIKGVESEIFNEREKAHMVDVAALYHYFTLAAFAALIVFTLTLIYTYRQGFDYHLLYRNYCHTLLFLGAIVAALVMHILVDFDSFWRNFHHLFFHNDLWLLDPRYDNLILMVPEQFFNHLVALIAFTLVVCLLLVYFSLNTLKKRQTHD